MRVYAYTRVSTLDQSTDMQYSAIKAQYPDAVFWEEKTSGTTRKGRVQLEAALKSIQEGGKLVVWKLDRLARDLNDLTAIVKELEDKGASLEILDQSIDTSTAAGKAFLQMLGVFAEFETNLRKERQLEGIKNAKEAGHQRRDRGSQPHAACQEVRCIKSYHLQCAEGMRPAC